VCGAWFSADTGDRLEHGTHTCFGSSPMDLAPGLQVLCYLTGRVTSPVRDVITIIISWNLNLEIWRNAKSV
jgi:hypothetical protein